MFKLKIKKGWAIVIIIIVIIIGYSVIKSAFKSPVEGYLTEAVLKGEVLQNISETGQIKATDDFSLGFKATGKVARLNVAVGNRVKKGDVLAELESGQIFAQLQAAQASLTYTTNQYDSGVSAAKDNLQSSYNSAQNTLSDSYTKIYNAYNSVIDLEAEYFGRNDQESIKVQDSRSSIQQSMQDAKTFIDKAIASQSAVDADSAISQVLADLDIIYNNLKTIREQCDIGIYYFNVTSTYKTSIDTQKTNINTARTNLISAQTSVSAYKIALQKAEDRAINSQEETITSSQIEQAQANVNALQSQLNDNYLRAPMAGTITQVNIKKGETVSLAQTAIKLLSDDPFQVEVYIYEQDIVNVKVGNVSKIDLVAFPKQTFEGKVLSIEPAETVIDNIVYYKVVIDFPNQPEGIKSGMTADIVIEAYKKDNVLRISKSAVQSIDGQESVQILSNKKIEDKTIVTGLEGNDYYEVVSGLQEGNIIITGKK